MDEEARKKIKDLMDWLYNNKYIDNNDMTVVTNYTEEGVRFLKDKLGDKWDVKWHNFCCDDSIWLPYPGLKHWDYVWYSFWSRYKTNFDNRLDLFINALGLDTTETDYIELDDIVL